MTPLLVVITGPTAVGKTDLCIALAQQFNTEILSADSRQFFKELSIGTAKPSITEMQGVMHHFIDSHSIQDEMDVNIFEKLALDCLDELFQKHKIVILTGGSGLYIDALCKGLDSELPGKDKGIREELENLYNQYGIEILQEKLKELDPVFHKEIDLQNVKRLYRAIEVCLLSGKPYSELRKGSTAKRPFDVLKIVLDRDRDELFARINQRVDLMIEAGLVNEVRKVIEFRHKNALKTVGYTEIFEHLDGVTSLEQAIENLKVNTRRYAKKQLNWFKRDQSYQWFHPSEMNKIKDLITFKLNL